MEHRKYWDINGILDIIGAARIVTDSGERIVGINDAACRLTGWQHDELLIRRLDEVLRLFGPDGAAIYPNKEALSGREPVAIPAFSTLLSHKGTSVSVSGGIAPVIDKGKVISTDIIMIARGSGGDVPDYARQMLRLIPDILVHCDAEGNILNIVTEHDHMLPVPATDAIGKNLADIFPEKQGGMFLKHIKKVVEDNARQSVEYPIETDQAKKWYEAKTIPVKNRETLSLITDITDRKKTEEDLLYQNRLRQFITGISSGLVKADGRDIDGHINEILKKAGSFFDVDRAYLFRFSEDRKTMQNTHEWCRRGISSQMGIIGDFPAERLAWWRKRISGGDNVAIDDVALLPDEAAAEKEEFARQGIKSLLNVPVYSEGKLSGFFGLDSVRKKKAWESFIADGLRLLANTVADARSAALAKRAMMLEREQFRTTLLSVGDGIISTDGAGRVMVINEAAGKLLGIRRKKAVGKHADELLKIAGRHVLNSKAGPAEHVLKTGKACKYEEGTLLLPADGTSRPVEINAAPIRDARGGSSGAVIVIRDCAEKVRKQEEIEYISFHDKLTGLYNRRFYEEEVRRLDRERNLPLAVIIGDVNGLKAANDSFGHAAGDELLKKTAKAFIKACRADDIIARIGGDEFVVLLPKTCMEDAQRICARISETAGTDRDSTVKLSITLAAAVKEIPGQSFSDILKNAEDKMYRKKLLDMRSSRSDTVASLCRALKEMNFETEEHEKRLVGLAVRAGEALSLMPQEIEELKLLAALHDIGKLGISKEIILKAGLLNQDEWDEIKRHSEIGYRIALSTPGIAHIAKYILSVHERWDGMGYPQNLRGNATPKLSRIISIIDAYDTMISGRPYKEPMSQKEALREIERCRGTQFDPLLVDLILRLFDEEDGRNTNTA